MTTLTLNVPDELFERVKRSAEHHRRSVTEEVIARLEQALGYRPSSADLLEQVRAVRARMPDVHVTDDDLRAARDEGRSVQ